MSISLNTCILILKEHHLLKSSAVQDTVATKMEYVNHMTRIPSWLLQYKIL